MEEGRSDDGRFTPEHTDGEILAAVRTHEPAATSEVAGELDMTRQGADRRLRQLREAGRVNSKKIGASLVWFDADAGDAESGREPDVTPSPDTGGGSAPSSTPSGARDAPAGEEDLDADDEPPTALAESGEAVADMVERVADIEGWEDTDERLAARKAAARAVLAYARKHGTVSKREAKEKIRPEYPVDGQNPRTWYRKNIRPVLDEAAEYDQSERAYRLDMEGEP